MLTTVEFLWRLNQQYVNRLTRARSYLDLLEQMLVGRGAEDTEVFLTLQTMRAQLDNLGEEQRGWCYTYFYESPETKRVVHTRRAIRLALANFEQMRERHSLDLSDLVAQLARLPRPAASMTHVPNGDLWDRLLLALADLTNFNRELDLA
jgi:hypothetical protein